MGLYVLTRLITGALYWKQYVRNYPFPIHIRPAFEENVAQAGILLSHWPPFADQKDQDSLTIRPHVTAD